MSATTYVVLELVQGETQRKVDGGEGEQVVALSAWQVIARVEASSASQAIRLTLADMHNQQGQYVGVPERSWQPIKVRTETRTTMRLEGVA